MSIDGTETRVLRLDLTSHRSRRSGRAHAKVVATIGPGSEDRIVELVEAGMSVARINFSHGSSEDHRRYIAKIREVAHETSTPIGVLADIRGPKLRLGTFGGDEPLLEDGQVVRLREGRGPYAPVNVGRDGGEGEVVVPIDVEGIQGRLEVGHRVILADGVVELVMLAREDQGHLARVVRGGQLRDKKGVHLPDTELDAEVPTARDREDLMLARDLDLDFVGVSFVSKASELEEVRDLVPGAMIVAKIERDAALSNIDELLEAADGIMVARGDLGVEVPLEEVPMLQKSLIRMALRAGKFTITATEMLESMITASRPTRAEVTDVANAVMDGSDAVMLSAETAVGDHPVEAVRAMNRIAHAVEASRQYQELPRVAFRTTESTFSNAVAQAGALAADALRLEKILCFTKTGNTVRLVSRYRPRAEVIALSPDPRTLNHMTILAHVRPMLCAQQPNLEDMLDRASRLLLDKGVVRTGEEVAFVAGVPPGVERSTNVLKLHRIGDPIRLA